LDTRQNPALPFSDTAGFGHCQPWALFSRRVVRYKERVNGDVQMNFGGASRERLACGNFPGVTSARAGENHTPGGKQPKMKGKYHDSNVSSA
jgi:hypothetical protein